MCANNHTTMSQPSVCGSTQGKETRICFNDDQQVKIKGWSDTVHEEDKLY